MGLVRVSVHKYRGVIVVAVAIGLYIGFFLPISLNPDYYAYFRIYSIYGVDFFSQDPLFGILVYICSKYFGLSYGTFRLAFYAAGSLVLLYAIVSNAKVWKFSDAQNAYSRRQSHLSRLTVFGLFVLIILCAITYGFLSFGVTLRAGMASSILLLASITYIPSRAILSMRSKQNILFMSLLIFALLAHKGSFPAVLILALTRFFLALNLDAPFEQVAYYSIPISLLFAHLNSTFRPKYASAPLDPIRLGVYIIAYLACIAFLSRPLLPKQSSSRQDSNISKASVHALSIFLFAYCCLYVFFMLLPWPDVFRNYYLGTGEALARFSYIVSIIGLPLLVRGRSFKEVIVGGIFWFTPCLFAFNSLFVPHLIKWWSAN